MCAATAYSLASLRYLRRSASGSRQSLGFRRCRRMNATRLWPIVEQKYKGYAGYQQRTDREIPLIFLD